MDSTLSLDTAPDGAYYSETMQPRSSPIRLFLVGSFRVERGSEPPRLPTRKAESLLAFLVLHPTAQAREKLAALLWGDVPDAQARGSLRKALTHLRAALGEQVVFADRQTVQLNPECALWCDARELERVTDMREWASLNALNETREQIAGLYRGDLLADFYDEWILPLREHVRARVVSSLLALAQGYRAQSEYARAMEAAQRVLQIDNANERAHQHLMFCFAAMGNRHAALTQYKECERALRDELGVEPARETQQLYAWLQQAPSERVATEAFITNVPVPLASFVGRGRELAEIRERMARTRLLTLTGPGGSGKTRLAIQTATDLICADAMNGKVTTNVLYGDGVWWVELAAITDACHVIPQIAKTLGVRESADAPLLNTLHAFLREKNLLLILDNCEHVLEASAHAANALLTHCPDLGILATSREPLRIAGEQIYPVPAMGVPHRDSWSYIQLLQEFEGIRLFVERAQAIQPAFQLTEDNASAVAQICVRLDGIPLALELAASRVRALSPQEIAARLDARFDLLHDANRAAPPRHQTLRAVLDWSCELLSERERALFRRLSVFAGGWTLAQAEQVCSRTLVGLYPSSVNSTELLKSDVLDMLTHLVDKSLVTATTYGATTRFGMLETIREYAREMLDASHEAKEIHTRHLETFLECAETAEPYLRGAEQRAWLARLDAELDNVRAALEWACAHDVENGLQLAGALEWFWSLLGHGSEGAQWLTRLLALTDAPTQGRARALVAASNLKFWSEQEYVTAREWLAASVAIYRSLPQPHQWHLAYALALYGGALGELEESANAQEALESSIALAAQFGQDGKWVRAEALLFLGGLGAQSRRACLEESAALFRELGDVAQLAVVLAHLAWFCSAHQDYTAAAQFAREGRVWTEQIDDKLGAAWYEKLFGDLARAQHEYAKAATHYEASFEKFRALGNQKGMLEAGTSLEWVRSQAQ